jgi:toxin ParE1/3/4
LTARTVRFTRRARSQLRKLERYLANRFYRDRAADFVVRIAVACRALGQAPQRGISHDQVIPGLRSIGFEGTVEIFFRVLEDEVVIQAVYYRGKNPDLRDLTDLS